MEGGFYSQGQDFSSVSAATSKVDARCYFLTFSFLFCFVGYYHCKHICSCCISLLNKRGASSEYA